MALAMFCAPLPVPAVIFDSTADPNFNITAPTGALAGSGWDLQGTWGNFLGTPIAPNFFITAGHIGGSIGGTFAYNGVNYATTAFFDDPDSDLRLWQIDGAFPTFAELYDQADEVGKNLVVFGRGTQRGTEVIVDSELKGWEYGTADHVQRWGENQIAAIADGGAGFGELLQAPFNRGAGANEAHLSTGDSGGGVFIQDGSTWKLAGISYAVDGPYSTTAEGETFSAALFDEGGLYKGGELIADMEDDIPSAFYATRISANLDWINAVIPEPRAYAFTTGIAVALFACWRSRRRKGAGAR